jgi:uncharacterized membrane protein
MSDLIAIAYEDLPTAQQVASNLGEAVKGHDIELDDVVLVERTETARSSSTSPPWQVWAPPVALFGEA